ncbi:hypothetical protein [Dermatobacter hominis]|uniref:hypothetical protein n=1 Tax=Dermatobacter hominis TaxID=2884263 RepID=UPI001D1009E1|nr:hypothetical protein [Dermatobacter hominis]UDY35201.1 hypothetical protein LH044_17900 [Dermatobacter hominis]
MGTSAPGTGGPPIPEARNDVPEDAAAPVALLLSVIGLLGCFPVAMTALAIAYLSRARIRAADGALGGDRTVRTAIVLGWVGIGVAVVAFTALGVAALVRRGT